MGQSNSSKVCIYEEKRKDETKMDIFKENQMRKKDTKDTKDTKDILKKEQRFPIELTIMLPNKEVTQQLNVSYLEKRFDSGIITVDNDDAPAGSENSDCVEEKGPTLRPKELKIPQFFTALQADKSLMIASYNSFNSVDYLSDGVYKAMDYDVGTPVDELSFPMAPCQGAIFYREDRSGSLVQFHNVFKSTLPSGEVFTIDELMVTDVESTTLTMLINPSNGEVSRREGSAAAFVTNADDNLLARDNLFQFFSSDDKDMVVRALAIAADNRCCYNVTCELTTSIPITVSMDFFPCTNGQAVVLISPLPDINRCNYGVCSLPTDIVDSASDAVQTISERHEPTASSRREYSMGRRLLDLNTEIKYLRDFRDNATLPMFSVAITGNILWANDSMIRMMGFAECPGDFTGSMASEYHVDKELLSTMFNMILDGKLLVDFPCNLKRRDGTVINVTYNSNAKFDGDGKFLYSRCIVQDMTDHNRLLQERDELQKKNLVAEMKEQEAIAASKTKSEFLAVMSHELRTPINGVLGATSLLGITVLDDEQRDYVNTITDSADILLSLISNILDISKIENGKLELDKVPLRFVDMVRKCADMMKYRASEKGISITTEIDPELNDSRIWHHGDPTRINQILLNFMSNAVKFTHEGGVKCRLIKIASCGKPSEDNTIRYADGAGVVLDAVSSHTSCDSSVKSISNSGTAEELFVRTNYDWLRLEITDTGCGIADSSKLFAPFVQANKSVHKKYGGTGLGLNISKMLVELMRGRVGIASTEGVGTTVWAEIPMRQAPVPRKGPEFMNLSSPSNVIKTMSNRSSERAANYAPVSRASVGCNNEDLTKRVRILIAEDNLVNQKVLKKILQTLGYSDITVTCNGQEAVDAIKASWDKYLVSPTEGRFDIVLMDCLMPVMDGWSATKVIRSLETEYLSRAELQALESPVYLEAQPTIILALTANATLEDKNMCSACGMDDFYIKPMPRDGVNSMMLYWVSKLFADSASDSSSGSNSPR